MSTAAWNVLDGARFETALAAAAAMGERDTGDATVRVSPVEALTRMGDLTLDDTRASGLTRDGTHFAVEVTVDAEIRRLPLRDGPLQ